MPEENIYAVSILVAGPPAGFCWGQIGRLFLPIIDLEYHIDAAAEVTIEANPGTINIQYLKDIRLLGINRLSLGLQSINDYEPAMLGVYSQ